MPEIDGGELESLAGVVAFLAVIANKYPRVAGGRDEVCLALTGALVRAGYTDEDADRWVELVAEIAGDEESGKRGGKAAATREKLEAGEQVWGLPSLCEKLGIEAMADTLHDWLGGTSASHDDKRPEIVVRAGFMPQAVDEAERALLQAEIGIFQRGGVLVRPVRLPINVEEYGVQRDRGSLILKAVTSPWLREQFARNAKWVKPGQNGVRRVDPPTDATAAYLDRAGEWRFPFLKAIVTSACSAAMCLAFALFEHFAPHFVC